MLPFTSFTTMHATHDSSLRRAFALVDMVESIQEVWVTGEYSRLITRTLADSNLALTRAKIDFSARFPSRIHLL